MGFLIDEPGGGYLKKQMVLSVVVVEHGLRCRTNQSQKADGTYLLPSDPGTVITVDEGDIVDLPIRTRIISEPLENGEGGGERIVGGFPYEMKGPGQITGSYTNQRKYHIRRFISTVI